MEASQRLLVQIETGNNEHYAVHVVKILRHHPQEWPQTLLYGKVVLRQGGVTFGAWHSSENDHINNLTALTLRFFTFVVPTLRGASVCLLS